MTLVRKAGGVLASVGIPLVLVAAYNLVTDHPYMSQLESGYWGGYYGSFEGQRTWVLGKFIRQAAQSFDLVLLTPATPLMFKIERSSGDSSFAHLDSAGGDMQLAARQLYLGKRYVLGRLSVGRVADALALNDDDAIRGTLSAGGSPLTFEMEHLGEPRVVPFFQEYVAHAPASIADIEAAFQRVAS